MADEHVPLRHKDHGGTALFPPDSVPAWRARGWEPLTEEGEEPTNQPEPVSARRPQKEK